MRQMDVVLISSPGACTIKLNGYPFLQWRENFSFSFCNGKFPLNPERVHPPLKKELSPETKIRFFDINIAIKNKVFKVRRKAKI